MKRLDQPYIERAVSILSRIQYATVATVTTDTRPWNTPVRTVYDEKLNFYWFSDKEGQHSRNVRSCGAVFLVIYDSTVPEGQGAGVYFEAVAVEVTNRMEIAIARRLKHENAADDPDAFSGTAIRRVYRATPKCAWTNDVEWYRGEFVRDFRVRLDLRRLRRALAG